MNKVILLLIILPLSTVAFASGSGPVSASATVVSSPFSINGNSDLVAKASTNSWPGSGTSADPYVIANYSITGSNDYAFVIQNTNLYFMFKDNIITGGVVGIYLHNVKNGIILNNSVSHTEKFGILFDESENNSVFNNTLSFTTNGMGLLITNSNNNLFDNNTSEFNYSHGFFISQNSTNNNFTHNYAISNGNKVNSGVGFYVVFTNGNSLIGNFAYNNTLYGIYIENSSGTYLQNNTQIGNGKILQGASYSQILLFLGIVILLLLVTSVLAIFNKKFT